MAAAPLRAPGRRGHRHARDLVADAAHLRRRGARPAPGPRRPGRHRHHQLDPADARLRQSEARFRNLVQTTPDVIYRCDADGRFLFMAEGVRGAVRLDAGRGREPDLRRPDRRGIAGRSARQLRRAARRARRRPALPLHAPPPRRDDLPGRDHLGLGLGGRPFAGVQGTVRDITQQERLERELRESQERYRFLVENAPDVVFSTDAEGNFTFMSEAMERISGWKPEEVIGGHFSRVVDEAQPRRRRSIAGQTLVDDPATEQVSILKLAGPGRPADPGRGQRHRHGRRGRPVRRHPRLDPRHQRARPARTRAARIRGALSLPRRLVARPRLADRREGHPDVHQRRRADDARHRADRAHGPAVRRDLRPERPTRRDRPLPLAGPPPDRPSTGCACRSATPTATTSWSRSTARA